MPIPFTRQPVGAEDIQFDTGGGAVVGTFNRTKSDGTADTLTRLSAAQVPVLDAPEVAGGRTPFAAISPASFRTVEACTKETRINVRDMKNFEHKGGQAGAGVSAAVAEKNTEVFKACLDELAAESRMNGIFFPGIIYEFKENAALGGLFASHILPINNQDGITLVGTGRETTLRKNSNANGAFNLLFVQDCNGTLIEDMTVDKVADLSGAAIAVRANAKVVSAVRIFNVRCIGGSFGVDIRGQASGNRVRKIWVERCDLDDQFAENLFMDNISEAYVLSNILTGASAFGMKFQSGGGASSFLTNVFVVGNILAQTAGTDSILFSRTGVFVSANHKQCFAIDNFIASKHLSFVGLDAWSAKGNRLQAGGILGSFDFAQAQQIELLENFIEEGLVGELEEHGIRLVGTNCNLLGFEIAGGRINNVARNGIKVDFSGGLASRGRIHHVFVLNNSRNDANATDYSSILLTGNAAGGVSETQVDHNILRNTVVTTVQSNKQLHGIEVPAGTLSDRILTSHNFVKGYQGASAISNLGTNPGADEPAAWDGGAAV